MALDIADIQEFLPDSEASQATFKHGSESFVFEMTAWLIAQQQYTPTMIRQMIAMQREDFELMVKETVFQTRVEFYAKNRALVPVFSAKQKASMIQIMALEILQGRLMSDPIQFKNVELVKIVEAMQRSHDINNKKEANNDPISVDGLHAGTSSDQKRLDAPKFQALTRRGRQNNQLEQN